MTKKIRIIILIISVLGFSMVVYTKFIKNYSSKIEIKVLSKKGIEIQRPVNLGEKITFLNKLEEGRNVIGISGNKNNNNGIQLKILKLLNMVCIGGMVVFILMCVWVLLSKKRKRR